MTDNDITKALECCGKGDFRNCQECKYLYIEVEETENCNDVLARDALDLITRQQLEIERLQKTEIEVDDFCRRLCHMRMLNGRAIASYEDLQNYVREEKSKAVKEFAKRLKCGVSITSGVITCNDIDNLIKEMVGDTE